MPWTIDPAHTDVSFSAKHLGVATVRGRFTRLTGEVDFDEAAHPTTARGRVEIDASSIDTGNEQRDTHLRSADFLEVEKYPVIVFQVKSVTPKSGDEYTVVGDLTIKDVTREVVLGYEHGGVVTDPYGNTKVGGSLTGTINRTDWGLKWNVPLGGGGLLVSDKIKIEVDGELAQSQAAVEQEAAAEAQTGRR
jgi:polyisoprenoid-binding protein YceI